MYSKWILIIMLFEYKCVYMHTGEYCLTELFIPKCDISEVVIVERASYGRGQIGRCVKQDFGNFYIITSI